MTLLLLLLLLLLLHAQINIRRRATLGWDADDIKQPKSWKRPHKGCSGDERGVWMGLKFAAVDDRTIDQTLGWVADDIKQPKSWKRPHKGCSGDERGVWMGLKFAAVDDRTIDQTLHQA